MKKSTVVSVDFNPWLKWIWIERLRLPLPKGYCGGRKIRQYRQTTRHFNRIYDAAIRAGFKWSQDNNGYHLRDPRFSYFYGTGN